MRKDFIARSLGGAGLVMAAIFVVGIIASAVASDDHEERGEYGNKRTVGTVGASELSLDEIIGKLRDQGYPTVYSLERDDGDYEVKVKAADGTRLELRVDPATGKVLRRKGED